MKMPEQRSRAVGVLRAVASGLVVLAAQLVSLLLLTAQAHAQSLVIPLQYYPVNNWSLGITVGINGGTPQPYLFDTGSSVFNAAYNPQTWQGFQNQINAQTQSPASTLPNGSGMIYCYGSPPCYQGNLVQAGGLNFYAAGAAAGSAPAAALTASPGYQISAVYAATNGDGTVVFDRYPAYFQTHDNRPILYDTFYGIFGAGNFAGTVNGGPPSPGNPNVGGVLGQVKIPGAFHQGYVVSANGQPNPASYNANGQPSTAFVNSPSGNQIVTIGGQTQQVSPCIACVTVGLTPQLIGQFAPVSSSGANGVVPWHLTGLQFPDPTTNVTDSKTGNNGSTEYGSKFTVGLPSGSSTVSATRGTLLDTGTPYYNPTGDISSGNAQPGSTFTISGASPSDGSITGIPTTSSTIANTPSAEDTYSVVFNGSTNILGIPFFMQNSVMFDLTGKTIGYTPFYVTAANLATTANGPLIVGAGNVPLGLAGVISGPGGVSINSGGAVQLSATNTYTGPTTIAAASGGTAAGQLLISGPGGIASSAGVVNNGVFDISRAWQSVAIQSLSGSGLVNLGGQNLNITNGSGTFSGTMADGGAFPAVGGSLTVSGGSQTLAGTGTFTGGTSVTGGTLTLTGTLASAVAVQPGGSFVNQGTLANSLANAGSTANSGTISGNVINMGSFAHNGVVSGSVANAGTLSGNGTVVGNVANAGVISPGNSIGTFTVGGNYGHLPSGLYQAELSGSGLSDLINVGGMATLQGGTVSVAALPGGTLAPRTTYKILTASGGVAGTYASVVDPYPFLLPSLSYDANNVYVTLQVGGFAAAAANANQAAVGRVIDANVNTATGDFAQVLSSMAINTLSPALAQATLTAISGQNYSSFSSTMVQGAQLFMNNFANQTGGGGSPVSNRVALAEACHIACDVTPPALWGAWGGALGGLGTIGANAATGGVTYNAGGFAAGLDRLVAPGVRVGVTTGYTTGTQWTSGFSGNGTTDTFLAGLYGNYRAGKVYADAVAGYAYSYNQMWRQIFIPGLQQRTAQGRTGANQFYGQVEGGYRFDIGPVGAALADAYITPFARLQGYTGTQNGFTESGAQSLNLTVAGQNTNSLRSVIGAQLGGSIDLGWREKLALQFRLGWSHEYANTARPVTATLGGAPLMPFTTYGIAPQRDGVVLGFSANTAIAEATSVYLRYEGNVSGQDSAHALTAGVRMSW
jgi:uncharacterized protein with beta-barrel porin domain